MSILDINDLKKESKKYLFLSIFVLIFGGIYEIFSHGVYTPYMYLAFLVPLTFGVVIKKLIISKKCDIPMITNFLYNAFIDTLTIGSLFNGVLIIYGTTNKLIIIYLIMSLLLFIISIILLASKRVFDD